MITCAELFKDSLDSKGLRYDYREVEADKCIFIFPYDGENFMCIFNGDEGRYLSIRMFPEKVPDEKYADVLLACNLLNAKFKYVKFYIDDDNEVALEDDAILSVESAADEAFELLVRTIDIYGDAKPVLMKAIYA